VLRHAFTGSGRCRPQPPRSADDLARGCRAEERRVTGRTERLMRGDLLPWIYTLAWILAILFGLILLVGAPFGDALSGFLTGAFGGRRMAYLMATLSRATLIVGMALSVMRSFRAGLFNIG